VQKFKVFPPIFRNFFLNNCLSGINQTLKLQYSMFEKATKNVWDDPLDLYSLSKMSPLKVTTPKIELHNCSIIDAHILEYNLLPLEMLLAKFGDQWTCSSFAMSAKSHRSI
jgi:hypothetical protein